MFFLLLAVFGVLGVPVFAFFGRGPVSGNFGQGRKPLILLGFAFGRVFFKFVFYCFWLFSAFLGCPFLRFLAPGLFPEILARVGNP